MFEGSKVTHRVLSWDDDSTDEIAPLEKALEFEKKRNYTYTETSEKILKGKEIKGKYIKEALKK